MSTETTNRVSELTPVHERLGFRTKKFLAWLSALVIAVLGGLLCATPVGVFIGFPFVLIGVFTCLSFSISMSATAMPDRVVLPLIALCLALIMVGRVVAPIDLIVASFQTAHTLVKMPGPAGVFGIPLLLIGALLVQVLTLWVRVPARLTMFQTVVSLALLMAASVLLLVGAVVTNADPSLRQQPTWAWSVVPLTFGLGVGLRRGWTSSPAWGVIALLTAIILPLTWLAMTWRWFG